MLLYSYLLWYNHVLPVHKWHHVLPLVNSSCFCPVFSPSFLILCFGIYSKLFVYYWDLICSLLSCMKYVYINFPHFLWDCPRWGRFTQILCYWVWKLLCQLLQSPGTKFIWWCKFKHVILWVFLSSQIFSLCFYTFFFSFFPFPFLFFPFCLKLLYIYI